MITVSCEIVFLTDLLVSFSVALDIYKQSYKYLYLLPQAFEANASSSGGIQTLIDTDINQDVKITTIESESYTCKRGKVKF